MNGSRSLYRGCKPLPTDKEGSFNVSPSGKCLLQILTSLGRSFSRRFSDRGGSTGALELWWLELHVHVSAKWHLYIGPAHFHVHKEVDGPGY